MTGEQLDGAARQGRGVGNAELADFGAGQSQRRRLATKDNQGGAMDGGAVSLKLEVKEANISFLRTRHNQYALGYR